MKARVKDVQIMMEDLAPPALAEGWDRVGLQVGDPGWEIDDVLVTLDVTEGMAKANRLIICHHPLFLKPLENLRTDTWIGRLVMECLTENTSILCAHTNLDAARGGTADALYDVLQEALGLGRSEPFGGKSPYLKLVVFVPEGHEDGVRDALSRAGAGFIGNYSHCTFQTPGTGTFMPMEGTDPFIGRQGNLEKVRELRLETILENYQTKAVIRALMEAHPYEEVAYDLYPLARGGRGRLGRVADMTGPLSFDEIADRVSLALGSPVRHTGTGEANRIAMLPGAGASFMEEAVDKGAQCLVTGDVRYHDARRAEALGFGLIDAGHFQTEIPVVRSLADKVSQGLSAKGYTVRVQIEEGADPFRYGRKDS